MISIIPYQPEHADIFKSLNLEWLVKFNLLEEADLVILNNPKEQILDTGGALFLAQTDMSEIVGSAGLINEGNGVYELAKMAVTDAYKGKGISRLLIEKCLEKAKELGAKKVYLVSNSQLTTAVALYEKYGFKHAPLVDLHYATADVKMELDFE